MTLTAEQLAVRQTGLGPAVIASLGVLAEQASAAGEGGTPAALGSDAGGRRVRSRGVW